MKINFPLLPHQRKFLENTTDRHLGLIGGFGCGKTQAFIYKTIHLAFLNVGHTGVVTEPSFDLVREMLVPYFEETLERYNVPYKLTMSPYPKLILEFEKGTTKILLRSGENYTKAIGFNLAFAGCDEMDTSPLETARQMHIKLMGRLRANAPFIQFYTTSTPEGFRYLHEFFVKDAREREKKGFPINRSFIQARTYDNPFLPEEYINDLKSNYPANLIDAYLEGKFTNLTSGTVYYNFDRKRNHTDVTLEDSRFKNHPIHIGQDFNVGKMSSVVHVVDKGKPYAVDEFMGLRNTSAVIEAVKSRYRNLNRPIYFYVDASGKSQHTNASASDVALLKSAFDGVFHPNRNPFISDRVGSMNHSFLNGQGDINYRVNTHRCPLYTETLEQQAYDKAGKPEKRMDMDHPNDAGGYFIHYMYPLSGKPTLHQFGIR